MLRKILPKSEFSRNVFTLMMGTTIAQAIPIAISPILTRLYTPEDFGIFALYMSIASIISVAATARYELAVMLPKKDDDAINIVALSLIISFFISCITFLIVFIFNDQITNLLGNPGISNWLYFIPITVLLTGICQSFNYWLNRKKRYKMLAKNRVVQSATTATANLGIGFGKFGASGLIVGNVFGQLIATSLLSMTIWKEDKNRVNDLKKIKMIALIKKYRKFPKYNLPNAIIDGFRLSSINILIAKFFTTDTLGQFSLAWKIVQMPLGLIGGSLSQVFFQKVSSANKSDLHKILLRFLIKTSIVAVPIFLVIYLFAVDIFKFAFGEKWELAGQSASTMAPWLLINFLTSPIANVFIVLNKQEIVMFVSVIYMLLPIGILFFFNTIGFIKILNIITFTMSLILIFYILIALKYTSEKKHEI